jgi:hypothetical protein
MNALGPEDMDPRLRGDDEEGEVGLPTIYR